METPEVKLRAAAWRIAQNKGEEPVGKLTALRKLVVQEKRDWSKPQGPQVGWKRGEIFEVLMSKSRQEFKEEWGDMAYYIAQSYDWIWKAYEAVTPDDVIFDAVQKYETRAGQV
jgi:hypothetical protein